MPAPVFYDGKLPSSPENTDIVNKLNYLQERQEQQLIYKKKTSTTELKVKVSDMLMNFAAA